MDSCTVLFSWVLLPFPVPEPVQIVETTPEPELATFNTRSPFIELRTNAGFEISELNHLKFCYANNAPGGRRYLFEQSGTTEHHSENSDRTLIGNFMYNHGDNEDGFGIVAIALRNGESCDAR